MIKLVELLVEKQGDVKYQLYLEGLISQTLKVISTSKVNLNIAAACDLLGTISRLFGKKYSDLLQQSFSVRLNKFNINFRRTCSSASTSPPKTN
jgi:hypothetical protein